MLPSTVNKVATLWNWLTGHCGSWYPKCPAPSRDTLRLRLTGAAKTLDSARHDEKRMNQPNRPVENITAVAGLFEGGLAVVALIVGYFVGYSPLSTVEWSADVWPVNSLAVLWGLLATAPMLAGMLLVDRTRFRPFVRLRRFFRHIVLPLFQDASLIELALISLIAGIAEEMLFRGLMQDGLAAWLGGTSGLWVGLAASSIVFGLAHAVTRTYAVLATVAGFYLGGLFLLTDNLLAPVTAHAAYNFLTLAYLVPSRRAK